MPPMLLIKESHSKDNEQQRSKRKILSLPHGYFPQSQVSITLQKLTVDSVPDPSSKSSRLRLEHGLCAERTIAIFKIKVGSGDSCIHAVS